MNLENGAEKILKLYIYIFFSLNQTMSGFFNLRLPMNVIEYAKPAKISFSATAGTN